ncbi:MAG TPA: hypothetical protein VFH35_02670, partial [Ramlibacter sp.]|nr:hypothetical protein [Ramlibacter sp.]
MGVPADRELRLLIHAPRGRDAGVVHTVLAAQHMAAHVCVTPGELLECMDAGAAGAIITEE